MCYNYKWGAMLAHPPHWIATVLGVTIMTHDSSDSPFVQIPLTKGYTAIVSPEDADLADLNWIAMRDPRKIAVYATRSKNENRVRHRFLMHRVILERILDRPLVKGEFVDHINHNGLDNRRENLRLCSNQQNCTNSRPKQSNTSGYKGIIWHARLNKWSAQIGVNGKSQYLGLFLSKHDAARAYNAAALAAWGEFAYLNEILE